MRISDRLRNADVRPGIGQQRRWIEIRDVVRHEDARSRSRDQFAAGDLDAMRARKYPVRTMICVTL